MGTSFSLLSPAYRFVRTVRRDSYDDWKEAARRRRASSPHAYGAERRDQPPLLRRPASAQRQQTRFAISPRGFRALQGAGIVLLAATPTTRHCKRVLILPPPSGYCNKGSGFQPLLSGRESNPRPKDYESLALPTELPVRRTGIEPVHQDQVLCSTSELPVRAVT